MASSSMEELGDTSRAAAPPSVAVGPSTVAAAAEVVELEGVEMTGTVAATCAIWGGDSMVTVPAALAPGELLGKADVSDRAAESAAPLVLACSSTRG